MSTSLNPIDQKQFSFHEARHLLLRAGFGGTVNQIKGLKKIGPERAVDLLVDYESIPVAPNADFPIDPQIKRPPTQEERAFSRKARKEKDEAALGLVRARRNQATAEDHVQSENMKRWWLERMILTPRPLQEKLTLLWHSHFASRQGNVEDSYLMYKQNQFFRQHANGNFRELLKGIVRDPAMLIFLNNDKNLKTRPNENLAREIMELFSLGIGNYTEKDIKEGARALTGYTRRDNDFRFIERIHDTGEKNILGKTGKLNADDFCDILLEQDSCPRFIAYKLYRHFVMDPDDPWTKDQTAVIDTMAKNIRKHDYSLKPVLKQLFLSEHFYSKAIMNQKISSPVEWVTTMIRMIQPPARDIGVLCNACDAMGQELFNPPSVAGWPTGRAWVNTATYYTRQNMVTYMITARLPETRKWTRADMDFDPDQIFGDVKKRDPETLIQLMLDMFIGKDPAEARRKALTTFFKEHGNRTDNDTVIAALLLTVTMPEAQLI